MVVIENIQIKLDLLTAKFNSQMTATSNRLKAMNATIRKNNKSLTPLQNKINKLSASLQVYRTSVGKANSIEKENIRVRQHAINLLKKQAVGFSNSSRTLKRKIDKQKADILSTRRTFDAQKKVLEKSKSLRSSQESIFKQKDAMFKKLDSQVEKSSIFQRKTNDAISKSFTKTQKSNLDSQKKLTESTKLSAMQNLNWSGIMRLSLEDLNLLSASQKKIHSTSGRAAMGIRNLTHGMRGFRMEALGVMFFGMSMQSMFTGLLKPVGEAFGVFDIFRDMLTVLFLPIMEAIFPSLLSMMEWFMNLPGPVKKAIGIFVIIGAILGTIIMILGTLALGLGSMILFWPIIASAASVAMGAVIVALSPIIGIIALIIAIVIGMIIAWKENFLGMKEIVSNFFSGVRDIFSGFVSFISGIFLIIKGIFLGDWALIWEGVKKIFLGAVKVIWGIIKILINGIAIILVSLIRIMWSVIKLFIAPFKWLWNKLVGEDSWIQKIVDGIVDWFKGLGDRIVPWIKDMARKIKNAMMKIIPDWMIDLFTGNVSISGGDGDGPSQSEDDFIWRPGQGAVGINPNDTLVGFKGAPPSLGGGDGATITNNFYGFTMEELSRELDERDRNIVSQMESSR